jgi:hypothetical protein
MTKELLIKISIDLLDKPFRKGLRRLLKAHPGKTAVRLLVYNPHYGTAMEFISRTCSVDPCPDLLSGLRSLGTDAGPYDGLSPISIPTKTDNT